MILVNLFLGIITFTFSSLLAFLVLLKNAKNPKNISFFIISIFLASWPLFTSLANYSRTISNILLWSRLAMIGPPIAIASILYFSIIFSEANKKISKIKFFLIFLPVFIIEFFVPTKYNIKNVGLEEWGSSYEPGVLFYGVALLIIVYLLIIIFNFSKKYKNNNSLVKMQIKYFLFALVLSVLIGLTTNVILPLSNNINGYTVMGPSFAIMCFNSIIAYSIIHYRLFDIRLIIQKIINYILFILFLFAFYLSLIVIFKNLLKLPSSITSIMSAGIVMFFGIYINSYIINFFNKKTNKIFFKDKYDYTETVNKLSDIVNKNIDIENMLDESLEVISRALKVDKLIFLLYDKDLKKFIAKKKIGFSSNFNLELKKDDALIKFLNKDKENVMWQELEIKMREGELNQKEVNLAKRTIKKFKEWDVCLCQPIIKRNQLLAIICLGNKKTKDFFTTEDLNLINTFNKQIAVSLENFLIYEEIKQKKEELEKSMNLMVGRELKMIKLKKEIKDLKKRINKK